MTWSYREMVAAQFAVWAVAFSRIIPFSGEFLVPIIYVFSKKVLLGYAAVEIILMLRVLPFAIGVLQGIKLDLPSIVLNIWIIAPLQVLSLISSIFWSGWIGAWFLRRKMRKASPDIAEKLDA